MPTEEVPWPESSVNGTQKDQTIDVLYVVSENGLVITIIAISVFAILANALVIVITVSMATLRKCISSYIVIHLCLLDILASCSTLARYSQLHVLKNNAFKDNTSYYIAYEFLNSFFAFTIIGCILTINIDKYYSIKFPMHYSSHVTKTSVMLLQAATLFTSAVFAAATIFIAQNGSTLRLSAYAVNSGFENKPFALTLTFIFYVAPTLCIMCISISVYRVAKRSLAQISAAPTITYDSFCMRRSIQKANQKKDHEKRHNISAISNQVETTENIPFERVHESCSDKNAKTQMNPKSPKTTRIVDVRSVSNQLSVSYESINSWNSADCKSMAHNVMPAFSNQVTQQRSTSPVVCGALSEEDVISLNCAVGKESKINSNARKFVAKTNCKALKNLVTSFVYFVIVWGVYFLVNVCVVTNRMEGNIGKWKLLNNAETWQRCISAVEILIHFSFVLNPVVYVLSRRNFKEESGEFFKRLSCWTAREPPRDIELMSQTFQQFLDPTSTV